MPAELYDAFTQPDVAALTTGDRTYRCYVWVDRVRRTIESMCFVVQDNGAEAVMFRQSVRLVTADVGPDAPKIIALDDTFVVHWLEGDLDILGVPENPSLHRAWISVDPTAYAATSTGTYEGSIAV